MINNYLKNWRTKMSEKIGMPVSQSMAAKLLGFSDASSVARIEQGRASLTSAKKITAEGYLRLPAGYVRNVLKAPDRANKEDSK